MSRSSGHRLGSSKGLLADTFRRGRSKRDRFAMILRNVPVLSAGKVLGCSGLVLGLPISAFFGVLYSFGAALSGDSRAFSLCFVAGLVAVFCCGVIGFVFGIVMATAYNLVASTVGGIELDIEGGRDDSCER